MDADNRKTQDLRLSTLPEVEDCVRCRLHYCSWSISRSRARSRRIGRSSPADRFVATLDMCSAANATTSYSLGVLPGNFSRGRGGDHVHPGWDRQVRFPRYFVFHQVDFMLPVFPDFAHSSSVPGTGLVIGSQALNAAACDYKRPRCIRNLLPSFQHA